MICYGAADPGIPLITGIPLAFPLNIRPFWHCSKRERETIDSGLQSFHEAPSNTKKPCAEDGKGKRWTFEQDEALRKAVDEYGQRNWKAIASQVTGRNHAQCLQRWNKVLKPGLVKGHWSFEEDSTLEQIVLQGCYSWSKVADHIPGRTAKQCRERWRNHLDPSINKSYGPFTCEEDRIIQMGFDDLGNRWTQIAELLPGRTEDAVKLRWKALNPNEMVKAKPGRPKLLPGMATNKQRSIALPTPIDVAASFVHTSPMMMPEIPTFDEKYEVSVPIDNRLSIQPMLLSSQVAEGDLVATNQPLLRNQYVEPLMKPLSEELMAESELDDVAMLKELLHSHSNSLLISFGSTRGFNSLTDISPEELLASGELDEMFHATMSISKERTDQSRLLSSSTWMDTLTDSFKTPELLQKAVKNLNQQDQHLFREITAQKGMTNALSIEGDCIAPLPVEPVAYSHYKVDTSRSQKLSLDRDKTRSLPRQNSNGILYELGHITNDIDDLLNSDLMRPIRKGKISKRERDAVNVDAHVDKTLKKKGGGTVSKRWTPEQDAALKEAVAELGHRNWMAVAERVPERDNAQCLQRWNKVLKPGLVKGPWSVEEDAMLMELMLKGYDNWRQISNNIPGRTAKQCRERWRNRLDPSINKSPFKEDEDQAILQAYEKYGNRWTQIAELLPGRTEDAVKLRWKALNPNQKTYTKLGRPRLLNTDDTPRSSTSALQNKVGNENEMPPGRLPNRLVSGDNHATGTNQVTLEPILTPLEADPDERMSEEDVMILNEFLRGHSNNSLGNDSFKSMLSATSFRRLSDDIDDAALIKIEPQPGDSTISKLSSLKCPPHRMLNKMLSLGDTKSASLRSITADVEPDESWINGGLTRRLSSLSVNEDGSFEQQFSEGSQKLLSMDSFEQQLASLNGAGSLLNLSMDTGDGNLSNASVACETLNGVGSQNSAALCDAPHHSLEPLVLKEEFSTLETIHSTDKNTMTAQDFYSTAVSFDQISSANSFEI
ncbi:hypothetical protein CCR75_006149 [Bremia lactucae]|uniref:Myb-like DNA-binding protein n=1 Tax=Bremia lactucae TaxID=4779 RepID=A0A976NXQ6_BRELC|nr:hypothetical protein CCR75_006149 [Bremia lactucae]